IRIAIGEESLALRRTFADVAPGALLALVGSDGCLEVALREGSAAERLGLGLGARVEVWGV
ncbi:MAG: SAM-dependent chlorinase/fluorinase, partial [Delftia sp.]|nr:SAM-dependent chlorinase/fluorinase [Delftia sp.]